VFPTLARAAAGLAAAAAVAVAATAPQVEPLWARLRGEPLVAPGVDAGPGLAGESRVVPAPWSEPPVFGGGACPRTVGGVS
jgi:hypothetical protein